MENTVEKEPDTEEVNDEINVLALSDEELENYSPEGTVASDANEENQETELEEEEETKEEVAQETTEGENEEKEDSSNNENNGEISKTEDSKEEPSKEAEIDYQSEYNKILAPFKANGREFKVNSPEEVRTLMEKGANYTKKMVGLKPHLKTVRLLEDNGIKAEDLNYLIDLHKKNPQAISKLVKESGIDPLDINEEDSVGYEPTVRTVSDAAIELDEVVSELENSPNFSRTINVVSKEWDTESKNLIANQPVILRYINDHMNTGHYDIISNEIEKQRMLGNLNGLTDLQAYQQVGDSIHKRGGFDHLITQNQAESAPKAVKQVAPKQTIEDPKLVSKRRAASPAKASTKQSVAKEFNPLALSDDEFEKYASTLNM